MVGVAAGTVLFLPAVVLLAIADLIRGARRLPLARLTAFGLCWLWLETIGVAVATAMWLTGRTGDVEAHYRLQRWWADRMLSALRVTCGVTIHVDGVSELHPAPVVVLVRHASLADSLLAVWAVTKQGQLNPRVVLKKELLADPCLDVVGNRLPNCFLDREAEDARPAWLTSSGSVLGCRPRLPRSSFRRGLARAPPSVGALWSGSRSATRPALGVLPACDTCRRPGPPARAR